MVRCRTEHCFKGENRGQVIAFHAVLNFAKRHCPARSLLMDKALPYSLDVKSLLTVIQAIH